MNATKINTNDIEAYIESLDGEQSDMLIATSESKWHGLPVVALELPNGTIAKFAVSSWADNTDFDEASIAIASNEIKKNPFIVEDWVVEQSLHFSKRYIQELMTSAPTEEENKRAYLKGILEPYGGEEHIGALADDALVREGIIYFLDIAAKTDKTYRCSSAYRATNGESWCDTYIGIDEVEKKEETPKVHPDSTRLDFKAMVDAAIEQSSDRRYGLPIVKMPNGKEYLVARSKDERASACRAAVMEGIYKYRPDFLENATGVDAQAFALIQENMKPKDANLAIMYIVHGTCGLDNLIDPGEKNLGDSNHLGCFLSPTCESTTDFGYFFYEADMLYKKLD